MSIAIVLAAITLAFLVFMWFYISPLFRARAQERTLKRQPARENREGFSRMTSRSSESDSEKSQESCSSHGSGNDRPFQPRSLSYSYANSSNGVPRTPPPFRTNSPNSTISGPYVPPGIIPSISSRILPSPSISGIGTSVTAKWHEIRLDSPPSTPHLVRPQVRQSSKLALVSGSHEETTATSPNPNAALISALGSTLGSGSMRFVTAPGSTDSGKTVQHLSGLTLGTGTGSSCGDNGRNILKAADNLPVVNSDLVIRPIQAMIRDRYPGRTSPVAMDGPSGNVVDGPGSPRSGKDESMYSPSNVNCV